jgi:hypothetical protein
VTDLVVPHYLTEESGWLEGHKGYLAICACQNFTFGIEGGKELNKEWLVLIEFAKHLDQVNGDS